MEEQEEPGHQRELEEQEEPVERAIVLPLPGVSPTAEVLWAGTWVLFIHHIHKEISRLMEEPAEQPKPQSQGTEIERGDPTASGKGWAFAS